MEIFEALKRRHSYRGQFADRKVSRQDLLRIVEAAVLAPSGCNKQTTEFIMVDDEAIVSHIASLPGANMSVQTAKAYIICLIDDEPEPAFEGMSFQVEDCAAAVENMLLAITALGYASVWIDGWLRREGRSDRIARWLGVPEGKVARVILPIGVPAEQKSQPDKLPLGQRAWFNQYDAL